MIRRSSLAHVLVASCILVLLLFPLPLFSPVANTSHNSSEVLTKDNPLRAAPQQSSALSSNATISVQPSATIDLARTMKQIKIEIALNSTSEVPSFNGVQIELHYSPNVLTASSLNYSTNVFSQTGFPTDLVRNCLDGIPSGGSTALCGSNDGPGVTSFAETILGGSTPIGTSGNIFFLTFNVNTTTPRFSLITFATGILSNGSTVISTSNIDGSYSSLPCGGQACSPAQANFSWLPKFPVQGNVVTFDGSSSLPSTGATITDYHWFFNDPQAFVSNIDTKTNSTATWTYEVAGGYSVTLTITDSNGIKASKTQLVVVSPSGRGDFSIQVNPSSLIIHKSNINDPFAIASSTVILTSIGGFSGSILLQERIEVPPSTPPFPTLVVTATPPTISIAANSTATSNLTVSATNAPPGNYSVTVSGTQQFSNGTIGLLNHIASLTVQVVGPPPDFQMFLSFGNNVVFAGADTTIEVELNGLQSFNGVVSLTGQVVPLVNNGPVLSFNPSTVNLSFNFANSQLIITTTPLTPPGNYTITATGTSGSLVHSAQFVLIVLPPPVLAANPSSGPVGTLVTIHGSGFNTGSQGPFSFPVEVQITFDDQLVGLAFIQANSFDFSFNIPVSQAGIIHQIHAKESFPSNLDVQTSFLVVPEPGMLGVSVSTGTIYFHGDTAAVFVTTSLNGQPITVSTLQIILILPNGSNTTLSVVQISTGYYRATYPVAATASLGTYAVVVSAHLSGENAQSALTTFEVKPTWLQSNAHNITTATGVLGAIGALGLVALAWRRGFFARKSGSFPDF